MNVGNASLPEYGGPTSTEPLFNATDPHVAAYGIDDASGQLIVDSGGTSAVDATFYDANSYQV